MAHLSNSSAALKKNTMPEWFELQRRDAVMLLKLNRPPVNALDEPALNELSKIVQQVEGDSAIKVVIFASAIPGIFCAGGDLKYWPHRYPDQARAVSLAGRRVFAQIGAMTKPSIAAIGGRVIGDGLALALACDLRLASEEATFHLPEVSYGFIPGWGTIHRLVQAVGPSPAAEMLLVGEPLDVTEAQQIGLVNRQAPSGDLLPAALALALKMAAKPPLALRYARAALRGNLNHFASDQEAWEASCFEAVWGGSEWKQGLQALGFLDSPAAKS